MSEPAARQARPLLVCSICERPLKPTPPYKTLFDRVVCKSCRNGFASRRQVAFVVDWILLLFIPACIAEALVPLVVKQIPPRAANLSFELWWLGLDSPLGFFTTWILPFLFFCKDGFGGRSAGKWMMGLRVIDKGTRQAIGFGTSVKRNLIFLIPLSVLIAVGTMMKGQRWGEVWANTMVVWEKHSFKTPFDSRGTLCTSCGYDLTGNVSGRCPECFTPVSRKIELPTGSTQPPPDHTV